MLLTFSKHNETRMMLLTSRNLLKHYSFILKHMKNLKLVK